MMTIIITLFLACSATMALSNEIQPAKSDNLLKLENALPSLEKMMYTTISKQEKNKSIHFQYIGDKDHPTKSYFLPHDEKKPKDKVNKFFNATMEKKSLAPNEILALNVQEVKKAIKPLITLTKNDWLTIEKKSRDIISAITSKTIDPSLDYQAAYTMYNPATIDMKNKATLIRLHIEKSLSVKTVPAKTQKSTTKKRKNNNVQQDTQTPKFSKTAPSSMVQTNEPKKVVMITTEEEKAQKEKDVADFLNGLLQTK
jgi:hypothetical protein